MIVQLRNLVWATSKHDVYLISQFSIMHWSSLTCKSSEVLNVSGHVAPSEVNNPCDNVCINEYHRFFIFIA